MSALAKKALRYDLFNFLCGEIEYELAYGAGADLSILSLNRGNETLVLSPAFNTEPNLYDKNYIRFYYVDYPEIKMDVQIIATVEECIPKFAKFSLVDLYRTYEIGDKEF